MAGCINCPSPAYGLPWYGMDPKPEPPPGALPQSPLGRGGRQRGHARSMPRQAYQGLAALDWAPTRATSLVRRSAVPAPGGSRVARRPLALSPIKRGWVGPRAWRAKACQRFLWSWPAGQGSLRSSRGAKLQPPKGSKARPAQGLRACSDPENDHGVCHAGRAPYSGSAPVVSALSGCVWRT